MKTLIALTALSLGALFSTPAQAFVRPTEGFIAEQCGPALQTPEAIEAGETLAGSEELMPAVSQVCVGSIVGLESDLPLQAFEIRLNTGASEVYRVTGVTNLFVKLLSGATRSNVTMVGLSGDVATVKVVRMADGQVLSLNGHAGGFQFSVPELGAIYSMM